MMKAIKYSSLFYAIILLLFSSCNPVDEIPLVTTGAISNVTSSSATCEGSIIYKGSDYIIATGLCWSTRPTPTVKNDTSLNGSGTGKFSGSIINLSAGQTYYVRAYATTVNGSYYGNALQITTNADNSLPYPVLNPNLTYGSMTDVEGNVYYTISIGTQTWMAENLRVTKYRNAEALPNETDNTKWKALTTGAFCNYNNSTEANSIAKFGRLYNFYALTDERNLAPAGWHIATEAEWKTLETYIAANLGIATTIISWATAIFAILGTIAVYAGLAASFIAFFIVNWGMTRWSSWIAQRNAMIHGAKAKAGGKVLAGRLEGLAAAGKPLEHLGSAGSHS